MSKETLYLLENDGSLTIAAAQAIAEVGELEFEEVMRAAEEGRLDLGEVEEGAFGNDVLFVGIDGELVAILGGAPPGAPGLRIIKSHDRLNYKSGLTD